MSDKIKDTINNLSQKYEKTSWVNILPPVLQKESFSKLLTNLLADKQSGTNWTPSFKDFFAGYSNTDISKLEVVVLSDNANMLASEELLKQNVLYLSTCLFTTDEDPLRYSIDSKEIMFDIVSKLAYQTTGIIFVFIGNEAEKISDCVDNKHHKKVYLPMDGPLEMDFKNIINNMGDVSIEWD